MLDRRTVANRQNGALGGPKTEAGKNVSRFNARKHGILAVSLSPKDSRHLRPILGSFRDDLAPYGAVEEALVEQIAVTYLRLQRCAKAESVVHHAAWLPHEDVGLSPLRMVSDLRLDYFTDLAGLFSRYDRQLTNQFVKLLHELERVQRMRQGEQVAPPAVGHVDVTHVEVAPPPVAHIEVAPPPVAHQDVASLPAAHEDVAPPAVVPEDVTHGDVPPLAVVPEDTTHADAAAQTGSRRRRF